MKYSAFSSSLAICITTMSICLFTQTAYAHGPTKEGLILFFILVLWPLFIAGILFVMALIQWQKKEKDRALWLTILATPFLLYGLYLVWSVFLL